MTIEEVMRLVVELEVEIETCEDSPSLDGSTVTDRRNKVHAALLALVAQARDEEAEAIVVLLTAPPGADDFRNYCSCKSVIHARIVARAEGGA